MKLKLDENLPLRLANLLTELGHDTHTVYDEGLSGHNDQKIWQTVQNESRFLITQDLDFSDSRKFAPGRHFGILVVRLHSPSRCKLIDRVLEVFRNEDVRGWTGCFVVASDRKTRVIRPENKPEP